MVGAKEPYLIAAGGRCYAESKVREGLFATCVCPEKGCQKEFGDEEAYKSHYWSVHRSTAKYKRQRCP